MSIIKNKTVMIVVQLPVTAVVTMAITDQYPLLAVYTFTKVVIRPAIELSNPGLCLC